ncbi:MAG: type III pantothenate kinase [Planctomycetaceae bacterium]|nr:type III pantothenate kinase [Planctomycetaceae bacterium]
MSARKLPLVAVDVGNSRIKLGLFDSLDAVADQLPQPSRTLELSPQHDSFERISEWLGAERLPLVPWWIGSVQRSVASKLIVWLRDRGVDQITLLAAGDLPLVVDLPRPDMVGIDRLLSAVAVNRLRPQDTPAVVVSLGTAITVNLVTAAGAFRGGAILPGIGTAARAMHEFTDLLPLIDMHALDEPPPALGTNTIEAMTSGIYWGAIGGVRHLIELIVRDCASRPQVFLSGGAAPRVAKLIDPQARYEPYLVLAGIALVGGGAR